MISAQAVVRSILGLSLGLVACRPTSPPDRIGVAAETASLDQLRAEVIELRGEPTCDDVVQCRTVPFGAKPCGGPWSYLMYSTLTADSALLTSAVERYNAREVVLNRAEGRISDCMLVAPPRLACQQRRCSGGT